MINRSRPALPEPQRDVSYALPATGAPAEPENLAITYVRTILGHKWIVAGACLLGAAIGFLLTIDSPYTYRARTSLDVQGINEDFLNIRAVNPTEKLGGNSVETLLQTEIKLLQSETLLNRVINNLQQGPQAGARVVMQDARDSLPKPLRIIHIAPPVHRSRDAELRNIAEHISVKPVGMTRLIEIGCESSDRNLATQFCNTLANEFVSQDQEGRWDTARQTINWLERQLTEARGDLQVSELKLQDFELRNKLLFSDDRESVAQSKLRLMQTDTSQAEADRTAREARYRIGLAANPDSLPVVQDDEPSKQYRIKLAELERQRAEVSFTFTPESPDVAKINSQIAVLNDSIRQARTNLIDRLQNEFTTASAREKALTAAYQEQEKVVSNQIANTAQLHMLEREAESGRQVYAALLQRVKEAGFASALKSPPVRVVDPASVPVFPSGPRRTLTTGIGSLAGLCLGIVLAFIRMRTDNRLRMPGDAARTLSAREFGVIPQASLATLTSRYGIGGWRQLAPVQWAQRMAGTVWSPLNLELITWTSKKSIMAEAYRCVMSSLLYSTAGTKLNSIVVSSPMMGEGKTTLVSNLGIALAEAGKRVVLVDADLRMPRLHHVFDVGSNIGLQQALRGDNDPATCPVGLLAQETMVPNLYVLPGGSGSEDPAILLHSPNLAILLKRLQQEFDLVLIDTPPMRHLPDARTVARLTRGVVLVLRSKMATKKIAADAAQLLREDGTPILGVILNGFSPEEESVNSYYRDYYRYGGAASA